MAIQTSCTSTALNLFCLGVYYYTRPQLRLSQISGIVFASILQGTRPYSESYMKKWAEEKHLDVIYVATTLVVMGVAGAYTHLP
ncbi:MAG: hypothetical protein KDK69_06615 [Chlamydiia bacterium]|nr:hypothetical protein [Chlamydiia bacterium]